MTALDEQLPAAGDPAGVFIGAGQRRSELIGDLLAAAGDTARPGTINPDAFATRPGILRRLAALLAEDLPAGLDRLATAGQAGVALTTALALHTGLPYAVLDSGNCAVTGEIHHGERLAVIDPVTTTGARALQAAQLARARGAVVTGVHTVLERGNGTRLVISDAGYVLHALFSPADLAPRHRGVTMTTRYTAPDTAVTAALADLGYSADAYGPTLNTAVSPAEVETIGTALAGALREHRIEAVAEMLEGLVSLQPEIVPGSRTALIATPGLRAVGDLPTVHLAAEAGAA